MYALSIIFIDHKNNAFFELGGVGCETREDQQAQWNDIPAAPTETCFLLDKSGSDGSVIESSKHILTETVEALLGEPVATLIDRARLKTAAPAKIIVKVL